MLDRVDSFLFAAPVVTLYVVAFLALTAGRPDGGRRVALLGSTGSIGRQAVDVLAGHPDAFEVVALAAGSNGALLAEQAARLRPRPSRWRRGGAGGLDLPPGTERVGGADALEALATRDDVDLVVIGDRRGRQPAPGARGVAAPARSSRRPTRRRSSPAATS